MKTIALLIAAGLFAGCATTPEGELTDGSKTALVLGSVLIGSYLIATAVSDDGDDQDDGPDCFIVLRGNDSDTVCR